MAAAITAAEDTVEASPFVPDDQARWTVKTEGREFDVLVLHGTGQVLWVMEVLSTDSGTIYEYATPEVLSYETLTKINSLVRTTAEALRAPGPTP